MQGAMGSKEKSAFNAAAPDDWETEAWKAAQAYLDQKEALRQAVIERNLRVARKNQDITWFFLGFGAANLVWQLVFLIWK